MKGIKHVHSHVRSWFVRSVGEHPLLASAFVVACAGALYAGFSYTQTAYTEETSPLVRAHTDIYTAEGVVVPARDIEISFAVPGVVDTVVVKKGDRVQPASVLGTLVSSYEQASLHYAQTKLYTLESELALLSQMSRGAYIDTEQALVTSNEASLRSLYDVFPETITSAFSVSLTGITESFSPLFIFRDDGYTFSFGSCDLARERAVATLRTELERTLIETQKKIYIVTSLSQPQILEDAWSATQNLLAQTETFLKETEKLLLLPCHQEREALDQYRVKTRSLLQTIASLREDFNKQQQQLNNLKQAQEGARQELEETKTKLSFSYLEGIRARIQSAKEEFHSNQEQLETLRATSPLVGVIEYVGVVSGQNVKAGSPVFRVAQASEYEVQATLRAEDAKQISVGSIVNVTLSSVGTYTVFPARVSVLTQQKNASLFDEDTYLLVVSFDKEDARIADEDKALLSILGEEKKEALFVPISYVQKISEHKGIVSVREYGDVYKQEVILGKLSSDGMVEIISGIKRDALLVK